MKVENNKPTEYSMEPITPKVLDSTIVELLTKRIADEFTAHYFYLNAANWCNEQGFMKAGAFFQNESSSELAHAQGIVDYLVQWNVVPTIPTVKTSYELDNLIDIINYAYNLEYNLFLAYNETSKNILLKDVATFDFLQKYREIQNDSVKEYADLLSVLRLIDFTDKYQLLYFENNYFQ
ncbi:MAG: hypothetical protein RLZZ86_2523 [Cyanobacteriota bacterium]|jgi:ferritin